MAISLSHQRSILLFVIGWVTTAKQGLINITEVFRLMLRKRITGIPLKLWPVLLDHYKRSRLGDGEGDTVYGQSAHWVTLVDRKSRFTLVKRVLSKSKQAVGDALIELLGKVGKKWTLTLDNGGEFADQIRVVQASKVRIYFAKPYASWQRGTNENTNGRIRRFWPKKFDMGTLTDQEIEDRIFQLNLTPRKILGGLTPLEAFTGIRVALIA